ncbi:ferredoxin family protein [Frankia sp. AgPm24]|uniref:Ferredoxin n=1 Tax=Frankia umida TaxID=573489 RepID=A0ABT0K3T9_9ACTN|nr:MULTISPECIES: ferredoxin family protein [Frankia]MCK9878169.1 ferredoxin family protein [Frankia umida]MCK9923446.1 ferredoxin family protein [Frankia sp. AgPm24]
MAFVIMSGCIDVKDGSCLEGCPADCIYEGDRKMYIHPDECTDCGACAVSCPIGAVLSDDRIKAKDQEFLDSEASFFSDVLPGRDEPIGEPGGATRFVKANGKIAADTPFVAAFEK